MGAEFGRIQAELLAPIIARCVWILKKRGKMPDIKIDGKQVTLKYVSPLARAQDQEDLLALSQSLELMGAAAAAGGEAAQQAIALGYKFNMLPAWTSKRTGLDATLIRSEEEQQAAVQKAAALAQQMQPPAPPPGVPDAGIKPMKQAA
jgi:hypothetical protein